MGDNTITISKLEYDSLSATNLKYGMLLEAVADSLGLNYDRTKLMAYDVNKSLEVGQTLRTIEPTIYNSLLVKLRREFEEKEKEENESID